ncbi:MAG: hypothetical protein FJY07_13150 [Bacteroidetes bacterium]|nr:hypothetical protein [Bacteroidota bacterium]
MSHGHFEREFLDTIAEDITREFLFPVRIDEIHTDLNEFYDPTRRQYDGNRLLKYMDSVSRPETLKTIGVFTVDLFISILTYIFGQAIFRGRTRIASVFRLKNEQYGMVEDQFLLLDRFRKLVIHELGHTFGLVHCSVPSCVMMSSTCVEDIDQKKKFLRQMQNGN